MRRVMYVIVALSLLSTIAWFLASGSFLGFGFARDMAAIRAKIDQLAAPAIAKEVCRDLARLGMTYRAHPEWFAATSRSVPFPTPWTPASVRQFEPRYIDIRADLVIVEFGGGFFHFGYGLSPAEPADANGAITWILSLDEEGSPSRELCRVTLTPADALKRDELGRGDDQSGANGEPAPRTASSLPSRTP